MTIQRYTDFFKQNGFEPDAGQLQVLNSLARLDRDLDEQSRRSRMLIGKKRQKILGVYLWGNVGRGKTYIMNLFFNQLATSRKVRLHFQRFMKDIHHRLFEMAGQKEPLAQIAGQLAESVDVICLDEFYIDDIADAMLVGGLLKALYRQGVILVTTSNLHPDQLYLKGMNRDRFLPAIELLKIHNQVICLDGKQDYRYVSKPSHHSFFFGAKELTHSQLFQFYCNLTSEYHESPGILQINHREMIFRARREGVVWFDFSELCEKPRSGYDYIELAQHFHTLLISNIPQLDNGESEVNHNRARRFISLIDELYDRSVKLAASFEKELPQIYLGKKFSFQFQRTCSRLIEMQTQNYMSKAHQVF